MKEYDDQIDMMKLLNDLAPLHRTLASNDTDTALQIVSELLSASKIQSFQTGKKIWSWEVPPRWELDGAVVKSGNDILVDATWHPLHVLNYSSPFSGEVSHEELMQHVTTNPEQPDAIPFAFDFYHKNWGFSIPHNWLDRFNSDSYQVEIKSRYVEGDFNVLSYFIPGENEETFIICSNICHPTQVNDSLTGVAIAVDIAKRLSGRNRNKYSYLVLVVPETIGSIAYLSKNPDIIDKSVGGFFSEMLGTNGPVVGQRTRRKTSYWDGLLENILCNCPFDTNVVDFLKSAANDEKVLDSPGVDIPTFSITRYPYDEYHTSDDNIGLINVEKLREARNILQQIIDYAEEDYIPILNQPGPIFLSGHDLYPDWRNNKELKPIWDSFLDVMYSIDGSHSVVELATSNNIPVKNYFYWTDAFAEKGLLTKKPYVSKKS